MLIKYESNWTSRSSAVRYIMVRTTRKIGDKGERGAILGTKYSYRENTLRAVLDTSVVSRESIVPSTRRLHEDNKTLDRNLAEVTDARKSRNTERERKLKT